MNQHLRKNSIQTELRELQTRVLTRRGALQMARARKRRKSALAMLT